MTSRIGSTSERTACIDHDPTNVTATPTTATSDAPVGPVYRRSSWKGGARLASDGPGDAASMTAAWARLTDADLTARGPPPVTGAGGYQRRRQRPGARSRSHGCGSGARAERRAVNVIADRRRPHRAGRSACSPSATAPSPTSEEAWFRAANDLPGWLYPAGLAVPAARRARARPGGRARRPGPRGSTDSAIAACIVTILKLVSERAVKAAVSRERPGTSIGPDVELRGDVHVSRRELRVRARRARRRTGRGDHAVPARTVEGRALGARRRGHGRAGVRRRPQPARRRLWGRARHRHRRGREPGDRRCARPPSGRHDDTAGRANGRARRSPTGGRCTSPRRRRSLARRSSRCRRARQDSHASVPSRARRRRDHRRFVQLHRERRRRRGLQPGPRGRPGTGSSGRSISVHREFVGPALAAGLVEVLPEYAGTAAEFHSLGDG